MRPNDGAPPVLVDAFSSGRSIRSELDALRFHPHSREGLRPSMGALPVSRAEGDVGVMVQVDLALRDTDEDDFEFSWYSSPILLSPSSGRVVEGDEGRAVCGGVRDAGGVVRRGTKWLGSGGRVGVDELSVSPH